MAVCSAVLIIVQASFLSTGLAAAVLTEPSAWGTALVGFAAAMSLRAGLAWWMRAAAAGAAATVKVQLRRELLQAGSKPGNRIGESVTLIGRGIDGIDSYITGYLPQLCLAVTVPIAVLLVYCVVDPICAVVVVATVALMPIFGILIGWHTKARTDKQWDRLKLLGGHFLDMVSGLAGLRTFGRAGDQASQVRQIAHHHRRATMDVLRVAFMSALVLELVATVSVALIAVPIGLRLVDGAMDLRTAFLILLLAPEVYVPVRAMGTQFHASQEGIAALDESLAAIDAAARDAPVTAPVAEHNEPVGQPDSLKESKLVTRVHNLQSKPFGAIGFDRVSVNYADRETLALREFTATINPGDRIALTGPSGAGKSTLLKTILGFTIPSAGQVSCNGVDLNDIDHENWLRQITWVPQRPHLFAMSVADNIRLGRPTATVAQVHQAAKESFAAEFIASLPCGYETMLGDEGYGLSAGQSRRIALARAFLRIRIHDCPLVLLDEPTASLDIHSEAAVVAATTRLLAGRTCVAVAHRAAVLDDATITWRIENGRVTVPAFTTHAGVTHA